MHLIRLEGLHGFDGAHSDLQGSVSRLLQSSKMFSSSCLSIVSRTESSNKKSMPDCKVLEESDCTVLDETVDVETLLYCALSLNRLFGKPLTSSCLATVSILPSLNNCTLYMQYVPRGRTISVILPFLSFQPT